MTNEQALRKALEYYANDEHYDGGDVPGHIYVLDDHGRTARQALATPPSVSAQVGEVRPSDDDLDPHLPESIRGAKRCGIQRSDWIGGWFVPWSPRNDNQNAEGPWSDWVNLAREILAADAKAIAATPPSQDQSSRGPVEVTGVDIWDGPADGPHEQRLRDQRGWAQDQKGVEG